MPEDMARPLGGRRRTEATALPGWIKPQLTKLVDQPPDGPEWLHDCAPSRRDSAAHILPIIWCLTSALTLRTMGASEGWIPLTAAALAVLAQAWPRRNGTCSTSDAA